VKSHGLKDKSRANHEGGTELNPVEKRSAGNLAGARNSENGVKGFMKKK